ncbi:hypothetical protein [Thermodesulfovibrio sp. TK110]
MRKAIAIIVLAIFLTDNNLLLPFIKLLEPKNVYAEIVETNREHLSFRPNTKWEMCIDKYKSRWLCL